MHRRESGSRRILLEDGEKEWEQEEEGRKEEMGQVTVSQAGEEEKN